jgi:hypothetical protein
MGNGQWSMVNGQWAMVNGRWRTSDEEMRDGGFIEFMAVLICALLVGAGVWGALIYLEGTTRAVALIGAGAIVIAAWHFLRKRFGRT